MKIILGIDIGSTTTKIVGINEKLEIIGKSKAATSDRLISMYGALGKLLHEHNISLEDVAKIALTGAGASWLSGDIYGIETVKINEAEAVGLGALKLSGLDRGLVMNLGTGTVFVYADEEGAAHSGGSGLGGATLVGLSRKMFNEVDALQISKLAEKGDLKNVDLMMGDVYNMDFSFLPPDASAANFGKLKADASDGDIALGLLSTIYQVLGTMAIFAANAKRCKTIIVTGALAELKQAGQILPRVGDLYGASFVFADKGLYATAFGAALLAGTNTK